jgi:WD40 repeat protein
MMRRIVIAGWLIALLCPHLLFAQGTKLWLQSQYDEFEKGQPESVAIASDGYLEAAPELHSVLLTPSTYIWSAASDSRGNAYLATGSPATVLKVSPDGVSTTLFSSKDLSVQTVQVGSDGSIYAATLPSGKVYRILPGQTNLDESSAAVVFDPATLAVKTEEQPKYIWALAFDAQGALYIATGGPAAIYRVQVTAAAKAKPELFFSSDEEHIRCLLFLPSGDLVAGSDGSGLVYKIGKDGKGIVLYDAAKREVTALAAAPDGALYVATVGEKTKSTLPPLPVTARSGGVTATITILTPGSVQASNTNSIVPEGSQVDELNAQGAPRKLWASSADVVYGLHATPQGLLVATGNRSRIYRVQENGSYADLAHAAAGQVTAFAETPGGVYAATSNTGRLYKLGSEPAAAGTYLSDVFDAGFFSTWGRAEINASNGGARSSFDLFARSGNIENPERNWGEWQKVAPGSSTVGAAAARFIQWKAVLHPGARITSVGINYLPVNVAPAVDEVAVEPGARVNQAAVQPQQPQSVVINLASQGASSFNQDSNTGPLAGFKDRTAVTARWAAHDDNGDDLLFDVYIRGDGEQNWKLLRAGLRQRYLSFDSSLLPDGGYRLKISASDSLSHPPGEALTGDKESEHFVIDTTPPVISLLQAKLEAGKVHATFQAVDASSPVTHAEYSVDAGRWQYLEPTGKISDSLTERYDFTVPLPPQPAGGAGTAVDDPAEHILTVRVYDRYDNVAVAKSVVH